MKHVPPYALALLALPILTSPADAVPITVQFRVQVDDVQDPSNVLAFALAPGSVLAGTYTYDTDSRHQPAAVGRRL